MIRALSASALRIHDSARAGSPDLLDHQHHLLVGAAVGAGSRSARIPDTTAECTSDSVAAVTRAANVDALNSWSRG
jgi:hypothetical protein